MAEKTLYGMPDSHWEAYKANMLELAKLKGFNLHGCNPCRTMFPDYDSFWAHRYAHKIVSLFEGAKPSEAV